MKKSRIVVDHLLRSFYKLLFISLGASVILSYLIFFIPLNGSFQREERNYFQNEVKIKATTNEHMILDFISAAEAIGSRTVIRQKLAEYQLGMFSVKQNSRNSPYRLPGKRHGKFPAFAIRILPVDYGNGDGALLPGGDIALPPRRAFQDAAAA